MAASPDYMHFGRALGLEALEWVPGDDFQQ